MKLNKLLALWVAVMACLSSAAMADGPISANIALATDYVFRGFTQTDGDLAVQGGLDYSHEKSGLYAGVWASNVESDPTSEGVHYDGSSMELDLYLGWSKEFEGLSLDMGFLHYEYPGTRFKANNTDEYHLGLGYGLGVLALSATANYSPDYYGADKTYYWDFGVDIPVGERFSIAGHYGVTDYRDNALGDDYDDWSVGVSGEVIGLDLDLTYIDTIGVAGGCINKTCDGRVVFTVAKAF